MTRAAVVSRPRSHVHTRCVCCCCCCLLFVFVFVQVHDLPDEAVAHLDLILQWCVLRMYESQVQGTARVISLLETLLVMLRASDHRLSDYEAGVFLPFLVQKSGSSKERFRTGYSKIMQVRVCVCFPVLCCGFVCRLASGLYSREAAAQAICFVFPSSKFVPFLLEGLRSKNNRTRLSCVEQLSLLVKDNGWQLVGRKGLRQVVKLIGLRDHSLRASWCDRCFCVAPLGLTPSALWVCWLAVGCGAWRVACGVWRVACGVWHVACGMWHVASWLVGWLVGWCCGAPGTSSLELLQHVWEQHDRDTAALLRVVGDAADTKIQGLMEEKFKFSKARPSASHSGAPPAAGSHTLPRTPSTTTATRTRRHSERQGHHQHQHQHHHHRHQGATTTTARGASPALPAPVTPIMQHGSWTSDGSPSPATKLAAAFDRTYRVGGGAGGSGAAHVGAPASPADVTAYASAAPSTFTLDAGDLLDPSSPSPSGRGGAAASPAAVSHSDGPSFALHVNEIRDGMQAHQAALEEAAATLEAAGASQQTHSNTADGAPSLSPGAGAGSGSGSGALSRPDLRRAVSLESGNVPEFITWVISGLQSMISMFNECVAV